MNPDNSAPTDDSNPVVSPSEDNTVPVVGSPSDTPTIPAAPAPLEPAAPNSDVPQPALDGSSDPVTPPAPELPGSTPPMPPIITPDQIVVSDDPASTPGSAPLPNPGPTPPTETEALGDIALGDGQSEGQSDTPPAPENPLPPSSN